MVAIQMQRNITENETRIFQVGFTWVNDHNIMSLWVLADIVLTRVSAIWLVVSTFVSKVKRFSLVKLHETLDMIFNLRVLRAPSLKRVDSVPGK